MSNTNAEWPEHGVAFLRDAWGKIPASEIGRQLGGRSKSAVVAKAHRMGLEKLTASPVRQKPLKPGAAAKAKREYARRRREAKRAGLPETREQREAVPLPTLSAIETFRAIADKLFKHEAGDMPAFVKPPPPKSATFRKSSECCWPLGEPGTPSFKFCGEPSEPGKTYCPDHCKLAYVPKPRAVA